ncbi:phosphoesterase [Thermococcus eurythermalis]|uniref:Phosphoesterase n=1 Tax=Thermococcus eurythermalis TaxID=1505907 RepID=A0A097QUY6_9EURY|nr:CGP-CTERM sorting domain-containing protein [Thermococcus eurythermalis]AIU70273.1 phosphoesterase [Thermococcus eurythermalis]
MVKRLLALLMAFATAVSVLGGVPALAEEYSTTYSEFLYQPAPAVPAFAVPGGNFTLYMKGNDLDVKGIEAVSILHGPYQLPILSATAPAGNDMSTVVVGVPNDVAPDDYFLLIKTDKGTLVLPNGLKVFKEWPKTLKIAWVSDTHITTGAKVGYVCENYFQSSIYKLEEMCSNPIPLHSVVATYSAYQYWAMNDATILVNTGDEVDTSGDATAYNIIYDITRLTSASGLPIVGIKGNHDDPPTIYTQVIGPRYFYVTIGKFLIIGLDTGGDQGYPTMEQIEWMEKVLEEHRDYIPIILYHHPYFFNPRWNYLGGVIENLDPNADWDEIKGLLRASWASQEEISKRFLEDVVKYNVVLTLSGHIHHDMYWLYTDKNGNKHYFLTLTSTGAPDKEPNPPANPRYSPTWYGSNLVVVDENGNVEMPYVSVDIEDNKVKSDFMSVPVPQRFIIFKHETDFGTALKFFNDLDHSVTGPIAVQVPTNAEVDPDATNITYKVITSREIAGRYYMLLNVTIPQGVSQLVIDTGKDTEKPVVQIAYLQPSHPRPNSNFVVYFTAQDNLGIRDLYAVIYDSDGNPVKYGKVDRFPAEPSSGKPGDTFYIVQLPGLESGKYRLEIVAEDFYGNKAVVTKELNVTPSKPPTATSTAGEESGICGPAAVVGLAVVPLLLRRRR